MPEKVLEIFLAQAGEDPVPHSAVGVEANRGVVGDRYYSGTGTFSDKLAHKRKSEITFIAAEESDAFNAATGESLATVRRGAM